LDLFDRLESLKTGTLTGTSLEKMQQKLVDSNLPESERTLALVSPSGF
jgi:hypothetical protein